MDFTLSSLDKVKSRDDKVILSELTLFLLYGRALKSQVKNLLNPLNTIQRFRAQTFKVTGFGIQVFIDKKHYSIKPNYLKSVRRRNFYQ